MTDGPIEAFLAELERHLGRARQVRERALAEVGDHLRDLAREGRDRGLDEIGAEAAAVERFGPARDLARSLRQPSRRSGRALAVLAPALAIACGALALSALRGTSSPATVALAHGGRAETAAAPGCVHTYSRSAGRRSGQILVATQVLIDPRTGRVLACYFIAGTGPPLRPRSTGALGTVLGVDGRYIPGATRKPPLAAASRSPLG